MTAPKIGPAAPPTDWPDPFALIDALRAVGVGLELHRSGRLLVFGKPTRARLPWLWVIHLHYEPLQAVLHGRVVRIRRPPAPAPKKSRGPHGAGPAPRGAA